MLRVFCLLCALLLGASFSACGEASPANAQGTVLLNEICSANTKSLKDADGESPDWIELYNPTDEAINLRNYRLTDDIKETGKFIFDSVIIQPHDYLIVFASKKQNMLPQLHAGFRLSSEGGESVYLISPKGETLDSVTLAALDNDTCYGRVTDGGEVWARLTPTPQGTNEAAAAARYRAAVAPPAFSHESGFYDGDLTVTLSANEGESIYYTLDGSDPSVESIPYTAPILLTNATSQPNVYAARTDLSTQTHYTPAEGIDKCNILRAVAVNQDGEISMIASKSYFIGLDRAQYENTAVVSLITDPGNLFDYDTGIYVTGAAYDKYMGSDQAKDDAVAGWEQPANYRMKGREWEREASFTYFDESGAPTLCQQVGIRVHGQASRAGIQKSLRLYARREYDGNGTFLVNLFDSVTQTKTMLLRNGGSDASYSKLRDVFFQSLVADRDVEIQQYIPCVVFLDGEYWGLYNLQQRTDKDYIEGKYGIDDDNVVSANSWGVKDGQPKDSELFAQLKRAVAKDLSVEANYQAVCKLIDMQSLIDHFCANIFAANWDWPVNNIEFWRARKVSDRAGEDGLWRYKLIDLDYTGAYNESASYDYDTYVRAVTNEIFGALMNSPLFREHFTLTMTDLLNQNFKADRTVTLFDETAKRYEPHMDAYFKRFIRLKGSDAFDNNIAAIRSFLQDRPDAMLALTKNALALQGEAALLTLKTQDSAAGTVALNTITPDLSLGQWQGRYFTDYPVALTAKPSAGYAFSHWQADGGSLLGEEGGASVSVRLSAQGTTVTAVFEKSAEARETLAAFEYDQSDPQCALTGNASEGYKATGGVLAENARLYASVNAETGRKLAWSKEAYAGGVIPVMSANGKNTWAVGAYLDVTVSTREYDQLQFTARLGASERGPRDLSLQYSLDGKRYVDIADTEVTLSRKGNLYAVYNSFALPDVLRNRESVHLRICVRNDLSVRGLGSIIGSDEGELGVQSIVLTGAPIPPDYGEYDALAGVTATLSNIPKAYRDEFDALLTRNVREGQPKQADVDAAAAALRGALDRLLVDRAEIAAFEPFLPKSVIDGAVFVTLYDGIAGAIDPIVIDVPFEQVAYLYYWNEDKNTLEEAGQAHVYAGGVRFTPSRAGRYVLLQKPINEYQYACTVTDEPLSGDFIKTQLLGGTPVTHAWLNISLLVDRPTSAAKADVSAFGFHEALYAYRILDDEPQEADAAFANGEIALTTEGGRYLLLPESIEAIRAEQALYASLYQQSDEEDPASEKQPLLNRKQLIVAVAVTAAVLVVLVLILISRLSHKKKK